MPASLETIKFTSAVCDAPDARVAMDRVCAQLASGINGTVDLAVVFVTFHHRHVLTHIHQRLAETIKPRITLGITTQGVIGVRREIENSPGISVLAARLPGAVLHPFAVRRDEWAGLLGSPDQLRQGLSPQSRIGMRGFEPKAMLLLPDPFTTPVLKLIEVAEQAWPGLPVVGGMASGATQPGANRMLLDGQVHPDGAVGLMIGGAIRVETTVSQGCRPIGRPYVITRAEKREAMVLLELGGKHALEALRETIEGLGEQERAVVQANGLLLGRVINEYKERFGRGDFVIRQLVGVDQEHGALQVADPQMRVGQTVQFHTRDKKTAMEDFGMLLEVHKLDSPPAGAMLFTCNGRGMQLFDQPNADANLVADALADAPLAGFFAAGELGPVGQQNFVHGHTASLVVFRQED
ncbi:MAG: FIST N-terminal domain-containing protein [Phycisphaeraceae bacterium]